MKLRYLLFLLLVVAGIVPLAISSVLLMGQNRDLLETQEKSYLTRSARFLSVELDGFLRSVRERVSDLGETVAAAPPAAPATLKLRQPWVAERLGGVLARTPELVALRLLDPSGAGPQTASRALSDELSGALAAAFQQALESSETVYRLEVQPQGARPLVVLAEPILSPAGRPVMVVEAAVEAAPLETLFTEEAQGESAVFLVDRGGRVLWSEGADAETGAALADSDLVRDFVDFPANLTAEYTLHAGGEARRLLARISPVPETGWGVVVHKPVATAFAAARRMAVNTLVSTALLVAVALFAAAVAARRISQPIQKLTETTQEIAAGKFQKRVEVGGMSSEISQLAADFNAMGAHLEQYVERLRRAAQTNREIFIGSMRAFVAAIDAKDPYTRGHSERVAALSRTLARFLGRDEEFQHRIWVGALLHDVGKIGIDDAILKKGGILSAEEYERMKQHPVIGAEIMTRIEQLREMLPIIRWHHEAWNGKGYPDGLKGEQTPLEARIVAVADTFDAITTNRPYQRAHDIDAAVETIRRLTGTRFDAKVVTAFLSAYEAGEVRLRQVPPPPAAAASA